MEFVGIMVTLVLYWVLKSVVKARAKPDDQASGSTARTHDVAAEQAPDHTSELSRADDRSRQQLQARLAELRERQRQRQATSEPEPQVAYVDAPAYPGGPHGWTPPAASPGQPDTTSTPPPAAFEHPTPPQAPIRAAPQARVHAHDDRDIPMAPVSVDPRPAAPPPVRTTIGDPWGDDIGSTALASSLDSMIASSSLGSSLFDAAPEGDAVTA